MGPAAHAASTASAANAIIKGAPSLPVLIGGESAGAHVALSVLLRLRDNPDLMARICGGYLCYGLFDLSMTPSQRAWGDRFLGLSTPYLEWFYSLALPGLEPEARRAPALSPLYSDLRGLPPLHLVVGELDPLLDDTLFLHQRLLASGNAGVLKTYPKAPHGFNGHATKMARHCNQAIADFLKTCLPGDAS